MSARATTALARILAIAAPVVAGLVGVALADDVLWGGLAWLGCLVAVLAGWGHGVARVARVEGDLGLRLAWGTAGLVAVAGGFLAIDALDQWVLAALIVAGLGGHAWAEWTCAEPSLVRAGRGLVRLSRDPYAALGWALIAGLIAVRILGAVASPRANPYDDDICYTPFIRRLLQTGDLIEPFSFRRLSAFGGQTVLGALAGVRGTLANVNLVDHGLFLMITVALTVGLLRERRVERFIGAALLLVLALLPDASINTASYWSGAALFLGLYRTAAAGDAMTPRRAALLGLVAAATCTLRQNYLPVAAGFVVLVLVLRLRRPLRASLRADRWLWAGAVAGGLLALAPYLIASWRSCQTFLYPVQLGTFNPDIHLAPTVWTGWQELRFLLSVVLAPDPIRVFIPLIPLWVVCRDRRAGRPLLALGVAAAVGFVLMCHAFALADAPNLWRYAFGYAVALLVALVAEVGAGDAAAPAPELAAPVVARFWLVACLLIQLVLTGRMAGRMIRTIGDDLIVASQGAPAGDATVAATYQQMQAAVPAGSPLVVMLDQPVYLDYARNRIINLDTPGHASYPPGVPAFRGAEPVAAYLRAHRLRYLAFVRPEQSRYFYRRTFWVERLLIDVELWRIVAAYMVDTIDNFAALAGRYRVLFDRDGLVVLDLASPGSGP